MNYRMKNLKWLCFKVFILTCAGEKISTVKNVNLNFYTGRWYQTGTSLSTKLFGTGVGFKNVSAEYKCIGNCVNNNISVINEGLNDNNKYTSIRGYSYCENNSIASKRKLVFENVPLEGNYWIVKLGPVENNKYEYAIISGPLTSFIGTRFSLYVLCRNRNVYHEKYEKEVKRWCSNNGFRFWWNKYRKTN